MKNILTSILTSILFFAFSINSFFFSKTKQFRKEIGGVNIDVYEARDKKKSMLFFLVDLVKFLILFTLIFLIVYRKRGYHVIL